MLEIFKNKNLAPSPITKPSRFLSNGLDAVCGSSFCVSAVNAVKPWTPDGQTRLLQPPANITSLSPYLIALNASPIECAPVAHAVTIQVLIPFIPYFMAMFAEAMLAIIIGI